MTGKKIDNF